MKRLQLYLGPIPLVSCKKFKRLAIVLMVPLLTPISLGRAYKDRSGLGAEKTKFTDGSIQYRADGTEAKYKPGGSSWTDRWLIFDNSYYKIVPDESADPELLKLSTDKTLFGDDGFRPFAVKFRDSQEAFFESYAKAHKKLSELGAKFEPKEGITL
jgi:L-ascorbate peroxidase